MFAVPRAEAGSSLSIETEKGYLALADEARFFVFVGDKEKSCAPVLPDSVHSGSSFFFFVRLPRSPNFPYSLLPAPQNEQYT